MDNALALSAETSSLQSGLMKISYIIPVYNIPQWMLDECLASIEAVFTLMGKSMDHEIIVVEDTRHEGASVTRNRGIEQATGDYIHFVDADDALIVDEYVHCLNLLEEKRPDLLALNFTTDKQRVKQGRVCFEGSGAKFLMRHNLHSGNGFHIFRRALLGDDLRFVPGIRHEDERMTPQIYLRAKCVIATNIMAYFYRQREGSLQHAFSPNDIKERLSDIRANIRFLRSLHQKALRRRIIQLHLDYVVVFLKLRVFQKFLKP